MEILNICRCFGFLLRSRPLLVDARYHGSKSNITVTVALESKISPLQVTTVQLPMPCRTDYTTLESQFLKFSPSWMS